MVRLAEPHHPDGLIPNQGLSDLDRVAQHVTAEGDVNSANLMDKTQGLSLRHDGVYVFGDERDRGLR